MTEFIRVRAIKGPKHEFDAPLNEVRVNPDLYEVLDKEPVSSPRPVTYIQPKPARASTAKPRPQSAAAPEPSVGDIQKENHNDD